MLYLFFLFLRNIQNWLTSRAESKRLKVIRKALRSYTIRRSISLNNNERNNLWKI